MGLVSVGWYSLKFEDADGLSNTEMPGVSLESVLSWKRYEVLYKDIQNYIFICDI